MSNGKDQIMQLSRRDMLKHGAWTTAAFAASGQIGSAVATGPTADKRRVLRIAHMTDIHVQKELHAEEGMVACLHHIQEHQRPDLILNTGDTIFDSMEADEGRVKQLWQLSQKIWKNECSVPVEHAIGNHDCWGVNKTESKTNGTELMYGKKWVMSLHGWEKPYRSFDQSGWHFIALDTVHIGQNEYTGHIDDEQMQWLSDDLARVDSQTPVALFGHVPIFAAAAYFKIDAEKSGNWNVPSSVMLIDARKIKDLFCKHPNVKLSLSGHLHLVDRVDYLGVSYLCNGAVSGGWWEGKNQEFDAGYGVIDLYADGTFENKYVTYGWQYKA